jgi:hypothetical protein
MLIELLTPFHHTVPHNLIVDLSVVICREALLLLVGYPEVHATGAVHDDAFTGANESMCHVTVQRSIMHLQERMRVCVMLLYKERKQESKRVTKPDNT